MLRRASLLLVLPLGACGPSGVELGEGPTATDPTTDGVDSDSVPTVGAWTPPEYDPESLPSGMDTVEIELDEAAMARLDADPYHAEEERGVFIDADGARHEVDLSYRGAYALESVIASYDLRNWKVKFDTETEYLGRREWNFNYEPHFAQKLAYDLFRFAGVAVPGAEHVLLRVNGEDAGMYLRYEDPDNEPWLEEQFGGADGDLYKAAYDLPGEDQCFADLTWLGEADADYACHYDKKLGDGDEVAVLRAFLDALNHLSDADYAAWVEGAVDTERLLSALVVSNFIAQWDSYPQRPKNYWLYEDRRAARMVFVPWDLDGTFSPWTDATYNQMGTTAPVLYNLAQQDYTPVHEEEGSERPLVRRLFALDGSEQAYLDRYRELNTSLLREDYLLARLEALTALVEPELSPTDRDRLQSNNSAMETFIRQRSARVEAELATLP